MVVLLMDKNVVFVLHHDFYDCVLTEERKHVLLVSMVQPKPDSSFLCLAFGLNSPGRSIQWQATTNIFVGL